MADFNRSQHFPAERSRMRAQITCPRCRVDPSHVSRQYWEATRPPAMIESGPPLANVNNTNNNGYPDLCPRSSGSLRLQNTPIVAPTNVNLQPTRSTSGYNYAQPSATLPTRQVVEANNNNSIHRPGGETWRIRGVFDSHLTPDVTRRTESNPGPLPDVTRHSTVPSTTTVIHHSRGASAPVVSGFETPRMASGRYPVDSRHRASSSFRETRADDRSSRTAPSTSSQWKREPPQQQQVTPWVTRGIQPAENRSVLYPSGGNTTSPNNVTINHVPPPAPVVSTDNSSNNNNNDITGDSVANSSVSSGGSCWRPAPQNVMSQCPLPDLVTPRRQARKQCCGLLATHSVVVRWLVVVVASLGLLCSIVGTVLGGVVRANGKEHLSIALLLIGLGIVLVSMGGIAWRLTSREGAPSCRTMFGLRRARNEPHRRFVPRVPHYGRPHPFSAMLYPDIPLRPPPPSYQASMQEYRLRLLLMDRPQMPAPAPPQHPPPPPPPPPPTYRGPATLYPRYPISMGPSDYSRPPSYRSRPPSSAGQPSPLGPEELDLNSFDHNNSNLPADQPVTPTATPESPSCSPYCNVATQQPQRPAPSSVNHVEVVAQV